jgi:preprotein translocase subunit SecD
VRRNRALWASIAFVVLLVGAAIAGLSTGGLRPLLGLDLQGGASVILSAPDGTPTDVMERALENIRNRVDAFGVGEPDIALSATTIEVQIPGSADASIQSRPADLFCLEDQDAVYGCADDRATAADVLDTLEVRSQATQVCVVDADGRDLDCSTSRAQAEAYRSGLRVGPEASPTPSATPSPSPSPAGPSPEPRSFCLTDAAGERIGCFPSRALAQQALDGVSIEVRARTYCVLPGAPEAGGGGPRAGAPPPPPPLAALPADRDLLDSRFGERRLSGG